MFIDLLYSLSWFIVYKMREVIFCHSGISVHVTSKWSSTRPNDCIGISDLKSSIVSMSSVSSFRITSTFTFLLDKNSQKSSVITG